jgi:hypothetical protein
MSRPPREPLTTAQLAESTPSSAGDPPADRPTATLGRPGRTDPLLSDLVIVDSYPPPPGYTQSPARVLPSSLKVPL